MGTTSTVQGSVTAPNAGVVIAQKLLGSGGAAVAPGFYSIRVYCQFIGGSPAAGTDNDNFELFVDDVSQGQCSVGLAANTQYTTDFKANVTQSIKVKAHGAGTASVIYDAVIAFTKDG